MNYIYVVAGNYNQFITYITKWKFNNYKCIHSNHDLYGLHEPTVILIGTYYKRTDWERIHSILKGIKANITIEKI